MPVKAPFKAFNYTQSNDPFIFVSYAHANGAEIYPIIDALHKKGVNIWYDEGIPPTTEWPAKIANAIEHCSIFLVFLSKIAVTRNNVRREIYFALKKYDKQEIKFLPVYLEEFQLPGELDFLIGMIQAINGYSLDNESLINHLYKIIKNILGKKEALPPISRTPSPTPIKPTTRVTSKVHTSTPTPTTAPVPTPTTTPTPISSMVSSSKVRDKNGVSKSTAPITTLDKSPKDILPEKIYLEIMDKLGFKVRKNNKLFFKILIYGCPTSGKKTSLKQICRHEKDESYIIKFSNGNQIVMCDWKTARINNVFFRCFYVKGEIFNQILFRNLVNFTDGIIFIWDSINEKWDENIKALTKLLAFYGEKILSGHNRLAEIPMVVCANKRDLPNITPYEKIREFFNKQNLANIIIYETIAITGVNIKRAFNNVGRESILNFFKQIQKTEI